MIPLPYYHTNLVTEGHIIFPNYINQYFNFRSSDKKINNLKLWELQKTLERGDFIEVIHDIEYSTYLFVYLYVYILCSTFRVTLTLHLHPHQNLSEAIKRKEECIAWGLFALLSGLREVMEECRIILQLQINKL